MMDICLPELGEGIESVEISDLLVKNGDNIKIDDIIIVVETEKASMEIPSTQSGSIIKIHVKKGQELSPGNIIISLQTSEEKTSEEKTSEDKLISIHLPELGEGIESVEISDILVENQAHIKIDDIIIVVETEKASMEIPSTHAGLIDNINVNKGDKISPGDAILSLINIQEAFKNKNSLIVDDSKKNDIESIESKSFTTQSLKEDILTKSSLGNPVLASPSVRLFSRELGCDLKLVSGTGQKGRITKQDVQNYIKIRLANPTTNKDDLNSKNSNINLDFSKWGNVNIEPLSKIKKITGTRLEHAWKTIPHVTQFDNCDITELEAIRLKMKSENKNLKMKFSLIPFFIKAITILLEKYPFFNSSLDSNNENIFLKKYTNIGIAVDTPNGLVVPVIKKANTKSIIELSLELTSLSKKAREKKLMPSDMEGGCFTISSLGGIGGEYFTPIINPPEVAIIGISRSKYTPIYKDNELHKRLILPISLSYDHRVIDGASAAKFTSDFSDLIENLDKII